MDSSATPLTLQSLQIHQLEKADQKPCFSCWTHIRTLTHWIHWTLVLRENIMIQAISRSTFTPLHNILDMEEEIIISTVSKEWQQQTASRNFLTTRQKCHVHNHSREHCQTRKFLKHVQKNCTCIPWAATFDHSTEKVCYNLLIIFPDHLCMPMTSQGLQKIRKCCSKCLKRVFGLMFLCPGRKLLYS